MCYVIENFEGNFYSLKWHLRLKALFFLRNAGRFTNLLAFLCNNHSTLNLLNPSLLTHVRYTKLFFSKMFFRLPNRLSVKTSLPLVINSLKSFQYWALVNSLQNHRNVLDTAVTKCSSEVLAPLSYHYNLVNKMTLLRLRKQPYKVVMFTLIHFLLTWWPQFNVYNKLPTSLVSVTVSYTMLRFYNSYFFKIYSF